MNSGMHDKWLENNKMYQGQKGYIAQMCKVHMQYGKSKTKWRFYTFFTLYLSILFLTTYSSIINRQREQNHLIKSRERNYKAKKFMK